MTLQTLIVVANKFVSFAVDKQVVTLSQLDTILNLSKHVLPGRFQIIPGQGVSDDDIAELIQKIETHDPERDRWSISALHQHPKRADASLSHKHKRRNTLIAPPQLVDGDNYLIDLLIDENCELMDDHQTGQHIQGMVLVEAGRQAFLAVTERFFLTDAQHESYFVINSMETSFLGFVFPTPAHIEYRVVSKDINDRRQRFSVEVNVVQGGEVRMKTAFAFTAYPDEVIASKEASLAVEAADFALRDSLSAKKLAAEVQAA